MFVGQLLTNSSHAHTVVGTPYYLSPGICLVCALFSVVGFNVLTLLVVSELLSGKPYNEKSDVWALVGRSLPLPASYFIGFSCVVLQGCVLFELAMLKLPFTADNQGALIMRILKGKHPPISAQFSAHVRRLVDACLQMVRVSCVCVCLCVPVLCCGIYVAQDASKRPTVAQILSTATVYAQVLVRSFVCPSAYNSTHVGTVVVAERCRSGRCRKTPPGRHRQQRRQGQGEQKPSQRQRKGRQTRSAASETKQPCQAGHQARA